MVGVTQNGGFADYCIIDSRAAAKLPDSMTFEQAAPLMCAGITIYNSIKKAEACGLKPGGTIGFSGQSEQQRSRLVFTKSCRAGSSRASWCTNGQSESMLATLILVGMG